MARCKLHLAAAALLVVLVQNVAAWDVANNCTDEVVGFSPWFGVQGGMQPMRVQNHTFDWQQFGPITKLNFYYSWNFGCLQGIKATYGYKAGNARIIGHEKRLYSSHLKLGGWENINRIDLRQEPNRCINFIKFYTSKGRSMGFGNSASTAPLVTAKPPMQGGFLAFLKGWEDVVSVKNSTAGTEAQITGGLQSLQFVWAAEYCGVNSSSSNSSNSTDFAIPPSNTTYTFFSPPTADNFTQNFTVDFNVTTEPPPPPPPVVVVAPPESVPLPPPPLPEVPPQVYFIPQEIPDTPVVVLPPPAPVILETPPPPTVVEVDQGSAVCPPQPTMCSESAAPGQENFCPVSGPFVAPGCEGGCCVTSGKCRQPLCKLNGLGEDVTALDFVCYGSNKGPFAKFNKCRGLRCKLTVPGCRTSAFGGNCVGYVAVDPMTPNPEYILDPHVLQYIGLPCIEVASSPRSPKLPRVNININLHTAAPVGGAAAAGQQQQQQQADGAADGGALSEEDTFASGLWTVCDCMATHKHPVLPAIPLFGLKKGLLGATHPLFAGMLAQGAAAVADSAARGQCQGPVCALLPVLSAMNLTLSDVQVPMTMLANLTALLHPQLLSLPPVEGYIPQVKLPEVNITIDAPITRPANLPTFADCAKYLIEFAKALRPVVTNVVPAIQTQPAQVQMGSLAKIASSVLSALRAQGAPQSADASQLLPRFNVKEIVNVIKGLGPMIAHSPPTQTVVPTTVVTPAVIPTVIHHHHQQQQVPVTYGLTNGSYYYFGNSSNSSSSGGPYSSSGTVYNGQPLSSTTGGSTYGQESGTVNVNAGWIDQAAGLVSALTGRMGGSSSSSGSNGGGFSGSLGSNGKIVVPRAKLFSTADPDNSGSSSSSGSGGSSEEGSAAAAEAEDAPAPTPAPLNAAGTLSSGGMNQGTVDDYYDTSADTAAADAEQQEQDSSSSSSAPAKEQVQVAVKTKPATSSSSSKHGRKHGRKGRGHLKGSMLAAPSPAAAAAAPTGSSKTQEQDAPLAVPAAEHAKLTKPKAVAEQEEEEQQQQEKEEEEEALVLESGSLSTSTGQQQDASLPAIPGLPVKSSSSSSSSEGEDGLEVSGDSEEPLIDDAAAAAEAAADAAAEEEEEEEEGNIEEAAVAEGEEEEAGTEDDAATAADAAEAAELAQLRAAKKVPGNQQQEQQQQQMLALAQLSEIARQQEEDLKQITLLQHQLTVTRQRQLSKQQQQQQQLPVAASQQQQQQQQQQQEEMLPALPRAPHGSTTAPAPVGVHAQNKQRAAAEDSTTAAAAAEDELIDSGSADSEAELESDESKSESESPSAQPAAAATPPAASKHSTAAPVAPLLPTPLPRLTVAPPAPAAGAAGAAAGAAPARAAAPAAGPAPAAAPQPVRLTRISQLAAAAAARRVAPGAAALVSIAATTPAAAAVVLPAAAAAAESAAAPAPAASAAGSNKTPNKPAA